ncbi:MAG: hypothetical protein FJW81_07705 [Actinobacteria bacterium]|nr:hypothetical protein [Actinomycetota bacterium]
MRRLLIATALLALLVASATASAKAPELTDLKIYRDTAGAGRGSIVITGRADYTRAVAGARGRVSQGALGLLTVALHGNGHVLVAHDSIRLSRSHHRGVQVAFHITIPASDARQLGTRKTLRASAWLDRVDPGFARRASTRGWRQELCAELQGGDDGFPVPCPFLPTPAPPAPPVGFEVWQGGTGDSLWDGASEALICVAFWGTTGYENPSWQNILINTPNSNVGYTIPATQAGAALSAVPASGTITEGSYYDTWPTGYANVVNGPALTVTVPTSILSSPVSSSTGNATLIASSGFPGTSGTWTLTPLSAAAAGGVC